MIKTLIFTLACIVSSAMLVSCGDDFLNGNWDPIEITVNGIKCKSNVCEVPANGGVFKIFTKNYGSFAVTLPKISHFSIFVGDFVVFSSYLL